MTELRGMLRKMKTELAEVVNYTLMPDQGGLSVNDLLGSPLRLSFTGEHLRETKYLGCNVRYFRTCTRNEMGSRTRE